MKYKVDKLLPTNIASIAKDNEHWVPYCEKAYAKPGFQTFRIKSKVSKSALENRHKKYITYDNIEGGLGIWGLTDLSGGIAIRTTMDWNDPKKHELFSFLYDNQKNLVVTTGIDGAVNQNGREVLKQNGLYGGHAYSLLKIEMVKTNDGKIVQLLQIRNPHGQGEWSGDWSDQSNEWNRIDRKIN